MSHHFNDELSKLITVFEVENLVYLTFIQMTLLLSSVGTFGINVFPFFLFHDIFIYHFVYDDRIIVYK